MNDFKNFRAGLLVLGIGTALVFSAPAWAQYSASSSGVMVDLSVIDGNGAAPVARGQAYPSAPHGGLMMPGQKMPRSSFIAPPTMNQPRLTLKKPTSTATSGGSSFMAPPPLNKPTSTMAAKGVAPAATPMAPRLAPSPKLVRPATPAPKPKPAPVQTAAKPPAPTPVMPKPVAPPAPKKAKPLEPPAPPAVKKPIVTAEEVPPPPKAVKAKAPKAPMPLPKPAAKPAPVKKPVQVAAISPKAPVPTGETQEIAFSANASKLPSSSKSILDKLAHEIKGSTEKRLQVLAYAGGDNLSASKARRLSLSRALAIRSYMIGQGVKSTRIDVRALGNKVPAGDPNRVDLKVVTR